MNKAHNDRFEIIDVGNDKLGTRDLKELIKEIEDVLQSLPPEEEA